MTRAAPEIREETIVGIDGKEVSFQMIKVEGGEFWMGSEDNDSDAWTREKPRHQVTLSTFWMAEFPVTQALWMAVMGKNPAYFLGMDRPVEQVSWLDVTEQFIPALKKISGREYRLPTEAEWEYAARGASLCGLNTSFKYAGSDRLEDVGWYLENTHYETKAVGLKQPNALGLYDMSGNVWEWCNDWIDGKYYETCVKNRTLLNPPGPAQGIDRVLRGGSLGNNPRYCRVSLRSNDAPDYADAYTGFRVVVSSWQ